MVRSEETLLGIAEKIDPTYLPVLILDGCLHSLGEIPPYDESDYISAHQLLHDQFLDTYFPLTDYLVHKGGNDAIQPRLDQKLQYGDLIFGLNDFEATISRLKPNALSSGKQMGLELWDAIGNSTRAFWDPQAVESYPHAYAQIVEWRGKWQKLLKSPRSSVFRTEEKCRSDLLSCTEESFSYLMALEGVGQNLPNLEGNERNVFHTGFNRLQEVVFRHLTVCSLAYPTFVSEVNFPVSLNFIKGEEGPDSHGPDGHLSAKEKMARKKWEIIK
ncbi:hypothetical protein HGB07_02880 [Candidatus Roizmanbacteria bacterium]|nr:hypothetical protein [Candidatus Roizmanbacteria bacterium]